MPSRQAMNVCLIGMFVMGLGARQGEAQTVELQSAQVTVLEKAEKDRFLAAHNAARKAAGVEPLVWSDELSEVAHDWLGEQQDRLIEKAKEGWADGQIALPDHRMDDKYGENIAAWAGNKLPGAERAVTWWLEEKAAFDKLNVDGSYKFGDEAGRKDIDADGNERPIVVGHYTQVVWRSTSHVGAAKLTFQLRDDRGSVRTYMTMICNYSPPGNTNGEKPF